MGHSRLRIFDAAKLPPSEVFVMINYAAEDKEFTFYQRNGIIKNWKIYRTSDKDGENLLPVGSIKNHEKVVIPARSIITLVTQ